MTEPLDPLSLLTLARKLGSERDEASLRTAVNRAYYALFLVAREKTYVVQTERAHSEVVTRIRNRSGGAQIAFWLRELFMLRNVADYELLPEDPTQRDWVANSRRALLLADRLLPRLQAL